MIQVKIPEGKGFLGYIYIYHYIDYIYMVHVSRIIFLRGITWVTWLKILTYLQPAQRLQSQGSTPQ